MVDYAITGSLKLSSADLQRILFGQEYIVIEQDLSGEPTPSKRLKPSSTIEEDEEVSRCAPLCFPSRVPPDAFTSDSVTIISSLSPIVESIHLATEWVLRLATRANLSTNVGISAWFSHCSTRSSQRATNNVPECMRSSCHVRSSRLMVSF